MRSYKPDGPNELRAHVDNLRMRHRESYLLDDRLDAYRWQRAEELVDEIWGGIEDTEDLPVVIPAYVGSITNTVVSYLSGGMIPSIHVHPEEALNVEDLGNADAIEAAGRKMFGELDYNRSSPMTPEMVDYLTHRGRAIAKVLMIPPGERDTRYRRRLSQTGDSSVLALGDGDDSGTSGGSLSAAAYAAGPLSERGGALQLYEPQGEQGSARFPIKVSFLDPRECAYSLGPDGEVIEAVHQFDTTWDVVCSMWPDAEKMNNAPKQRLGRPGGSGINRTCQVTDYWNTEYNAIAIDGQWYKPPKKHHYRSIDGDPCCPIVVEIVDPQPARESRYRVRRPTPFVSQILDSLRWIAWAQSLVAFILNNAAFNVVIHKGLDPDGGSPHLHVRTGPDGKKIIEYAPPEGMFNTSPDSRIWLAFGNEDFKQMDPPRVIELLESFIAEQKMSIRINTFDEALLAGITMSEPSGYAYNLSRQAAMARIAKINRGGDRMLSKISTMAVGHLRNGWDYGHTDREPYRIYSGGPNDVLDPVDVDLIGRIEVRIAPDIQINQDQENKVVFDARSTGTMSLLTAIDRLGLVDDAQEELKRINFERVVENDPTIQLQMAHQYMRENKLGPYAGGEGEAPAAPAPAGPVPGALPGGPQLPLGPGGGPPGMAAMAPGAQDPMAALAAAGGMGGAVPGQTPAPAGPGMGGAGPAGGNPLEQLIAENPMMLMQLLGGQ